MKGIWSMRRQKGFTLVELLVVIAIIGVLATLVLLQLGTARGRARDTQRITTVAQLRDAVEQYYEDNDATYPDDLDSLVTAKLIPRLPNDPLSDSVEYGYVKDDTTDSYQIWIELENKAQALNNDSDKDFSAITGGVNGAKEPAAGAQCDGSITTVDCVYDVAVDNR